MNGRRASALLLVLVLLAPALVVGGGALATAPPASESSASHLSAATNPVTGSVSGPSVVATNSTSVFRVNATGGPAVSANGTLIGNLTFYVSVVGPNTTGVDFTPASTNLTGRSPRVANLVVGNSTETLSIDVEITSTYAQQNESTNFSYTVQVVQPYVVSATIVNPTNATVSAFSVYITLDGNVIGRVNVSSLLAGGSYKLTYRYPTTGLSVGEHTFAVSLVQEHGLVTFANGQSVYTESVYVAGPAPNYTLWYLAGTVAFFGAIFIFVSRVAARRRGLTRR